MITEQKNVLKAVEILWNDWDLIGVKDTEETRDKYSSYALQIFGLKIHNADKAAHAKANERFLIFPVRTKCG